MSGLMPSARIASALKEIEAQHGIAILYACESGSRGWGFASQDSDYDVRFIYQNPRNWYLSIDEKRDVVELPINDELDINGWDLRKALRLLRKSNPALFEWLSSPIVYRQDEEFVSGFRILARDYYFPAACLQHYLHMAKGNHREYLQGETVWLKKYLYVLRPVLIELSVLIVVDDVTLQATITELLARKGAGHELDSGPRIPAISEFLEGQLARLGREVADIRLRYPDGVPRGKAPSSSWSRMLIMQ